jgi:hypothetical protein
MKHWWIVVIVAIVALCVVYVVTVGYEKGEGSPTGELSAKPFYEVRWTSRYDQWSYSTQLESQVFLNEADAQRFESALKDAFKLIRTTHGAETKIVKHNGVDL